MQDDVLAMSVTLNRLVCIYTGPAHFADMHMQINSG
jgi:hypothetical protein